MVRGLKSITYRERLRETGLFSLEKKARDILRAAYSYQDEKNYKESCLTLSALADRVRKSNGHKRQHGKFRLDMMTNFFTRRVVKPSNRLSTEAVDSLSLDVFTTWLDKATADPR